MIETRYFILKTFTDDEAETCQRCNLQELVHCRDCRQNGQCSIQFKFADADNPGEWFCPDGNRKEDR